MKILVSGTHGMLGSEIINALEKSSIPSQPLDREAFLRMLPSEQQFFLSGFDCIIHAAANTNVEYCELHSDQAFFDNCHLTMKLFDASREVDAKFIFISSTGVYGNGKSSPYNEFDQVNPTTVHHKSKKFSEDYVLKSLRSLVIRTGWLYGGEAESAKNFVVNRILEAANSKGIIYANYQQIGCPTSARDCAHYIVDLIKLDATGIYNVVNSGVASRFDYVNFIVETTLSSIEVCPVPSSTFNRKAKVPDNESAVSLRLKFDGIKPLDDWKISLKSYIDQLDVEKLLLKIKKTKAAHYRVYD